MVKLCKILLYSERKSSKIHGLNFKFSAQFARRNFNWATPATFGNFSGDDVKTSRWRVRIFNLIIIRIVLKHDMKCKIIKARRIFSRLYIRVIARSLFYSNSRFC